MRPLIKYFTPPDLPDNEEVKRKSRLTIGALLIITYFNLNYSIISWFIEYQGGLYSQIPLFVVSLITLWLYRAGFARSIILSVYFIICSISIGITVFYTDGYSSKLFSWLATTPIVALLVWSKRGSVLSLITVFLLEITFFYLDRQNFDFPNQIKPEYAPIFFLTINLGLVLILYWIGYFFEKAKDEALQALESKNLELSNEKKKSDDLLLNILPESVAEELKNTGKAKARLFENVTILFTDIIDFTLISESLTPEDLVDELNFCFTGFDHIIMKHKMEKIKTIGDAYIAVAGLPLEDNDHAKIVVNAALEMVEFTQQYKLERIKLNKPYFEFRTGINSGSVVAGIVGVKKFVYDIWGDAANIAARMEQNCEAGKVNVSQQTYELVKNDFQAVHRGKIEAKNKGAIDMYFLDYLKKTE